MKFANMYTYRPAKGEVFVGKSLTVPEQTLSLKTLLERFVRGQDVMQFEPVFTDDPLITDLVGMDAVERTAMLSEVKQYVRRGVKAPELVEDSSKGSPPDQTDGE